MICFLENFLSEQDCNDIIQFFCDSDKLRQSNKEFDNRTLNYDLITNPIIKNKMNVYRWKLTFEICKLYKEDILYPQFLDLVLWKQGDKMEYHADNVFRNGEPNNTSFRDYSTVCYLNDNYTGGETIFTDTGEKIKPKKGSVLIFKSNMNHEVSEIVLGTRYTMPMWLSKDERYLNL